MRGVEPVGRGEIVGHLPGGRSAGAEAQHDDRDRSGAHGLGHRFDVQRPGRRQQAADRQPADQAQEDQHLGRLGIAGDERQHGGQHGADQDDRAAPDEIGGIGPDEGADHLADERRHADVAHHGLAQLHLVPDIGERVGDQREIQPVEERHQAGQDQQPPMEGRDAEPLQELTDIEDGPAGRAGPRHSPLVHPASLLLCAPALRPFGSMLSICPACLTGNPPGTKPRPAPGPDGLTCAAKRRVGQPA